MQVAETIVLLLCHLGVERTKRLQVVGECARDNDLEVNPVREKKLTNIRTVNADEKVCAPSPACYIVGPHNQVALVHAQC